MQPLFRIDRIRLQNFRCFDDISVELNERLTVFYAENAGGKTAMLNGIVIAIAGTLYGTFPSLEQTDVSEQIQGSLTRTQRFPCRAGAEGIIGGAATKWARELSGVGRKTTTKETQHVRAILAPIYASNTDDWPVLAFYGTQRLWDVMKTHAKGPGKGTRRNDGYKDALNPRSRERELLEWLFRVSMARLQHGTPPTELTAFESAMSAALPTWLGQEVVRVEYDIANDEPVLRLANGDLMPWSRLSDGFHVFLGMVADLARRCVTLNPHLGDRAVIEAQGTVVIDEVDLHLHPRWQRDVLPSLLRAFPRLQFVVSTHSPQVLSAVTNEQVRTLSGWKLVPSAPVEGRDSNSILVEAFNTPPRPPSAIDALASELDRALENEKLTEARELLSRLRERWGTLAPEVIRSEQLLRAAEGR